MCFGGGGASDEIAKQEELRRGRIQEGMTNINKVFSGFTPSFFKQANDQVINTMMPQLVDQYGAVRESTAHSLASTGLLKSSAADKMRSTMDKEYARNQVLVANQGLEAERNLQKQVQQQKSEVINQLQASADPTLAAQSAAGAAANISSPSITQPLGNMFSSWVNTYLVSNLNKGLAQDRASQLEIQKQLSNLGNNYKVSK